MPSEREQSVPPLLGETVAAAIVAVFDVGRQLLESSAEVCARRDESIRLGQIPRTAMIKSAVTLDTATVERHVHGDVQEAIAVAVVVNTLCGRD